MRGYALVDDADFAWLNQWKWSIGKVGYAFRSSGIYMHSIINKTPKGMITDHINRNKLDNRRRNLRTLTRGQNQLNRNRETKSSSGFLGVVWDKVNDKWEVNIHRNGSNHKIGRFKILSDAIKARKEAELIYHQI